MNRLHFNLCLVLQLNHGDGFGLKFTTLCEIDWVLFGDWELNACITDSSATEN